MGVDVSGVVAVEAYILVDAAHEAKRFLLCVNFLFEPVVATLFQFKSQFGATCADYAPLVENMDKIGLNIVEQTLIM